VETADDRPELPSALDYLQLARAQEDRCDATTRLRLPFLGEKAPALVVNSLLLKGGGASSFRRCPGLESSASLVVARA
jgi:hypothetical protein